jgi:hypothetical protein
VAKEFAAIAFVLVLVVVAMGYFALVWWRDYRIVNRSEEKEIRDAATKLPR